MLQTKRIVTQMVPRQDVPGTRQSAPPQQSPSINAGGITAGIGRLPARILQGFFK